MHTFAREKNELTKKELSCCDCSWLLQRRVRDYHYCKKVNNKPDSIIPTCTNWLLREKSLSRIISRRKQEFSSPTVAMDICHASVRHGHTSVRFLCSDSTSNLKQDVWWLRCQLLMTVRWWRNIWVKSRNRFLRILLVIDEQSRYLNRYGRTVVLKELIWLELSTDEVICSTWIDWTSIEYIQDFGYEWFW